MQARIDQMFGTRGGIEALSVGVRERPDGVRWARSCAGPVLNEDAPNLTCYGCNESLSFVRAHTSVRNGIRHDVSAFYRHRSGSRCSAKTVLHKAAKHALWVHGRRWKLFCPCGVCREPIPVEVSCNERDPFGGETACGRCKLDVGVVREGGSVVGAVKVAVTHASTEEKLRELTEGGVAWCEVHAHGILEAVEADVFEAEAPKCAQPMCDRCVEREQKRAIREFDHELMRSAADADKLRRKRQRIIDEAASQWRQMVPAESHCDKQAKWALLTQCVQKTVAAKASELGLCAEAVKAHADAVLDGEPVLKFGKHEGRTLSAVAGTDWPYLLWLAGLNFGKMDERGRAERQVARAGTGYITGDVEAEARRMVQGSCFNCQDDICDHAEQPWRTWCRRCYAQLRYE